MIWSEVFGIFVLYFTTCTSKMEPFILGGEFARIENYPHSVFLYMLCGDPQACGGSVLTQKAVLTAGHCFEYCSKKYSVVAYAGSEDTERMLVADKIIDFRIHKDYKTKTLHNDIALGSLETSMKLGKTIQRVIIRRNFPGVMMGHIAGWGIVNEATGQQTQKLKMVTQTVQHVSSCAAVIKLKHGMMCAKNSKKNHPSRGDSGSALVSIKGQQIGLVSFRITDRKELVVYTNVSYYYDWIEKEEQTHTMEPYIIGGQIATIEQFPHTVYMLLTCVGESWICGASILTQNLVLSAAHCFKRCHQDVDVNVYVGSANIHQMPVARYVSEYMLHRTFDAKLFRDDIALARTQEEMPLGRTIKRVLLEKKFPRITRAQVAGWGILDDAQSEGKGQLQWLPQSIRPGGICSRFSLAPGMMCVENHIESRPSHGDSGSALMANFVQQIGLVSFRHPQIIQLIIYTNVTYYYNWIQRNARQLTCIKDV